MQNHNIYHNTMQLGSAQQTLVSQPLTWYEGSHSLCINRSVKAARDWWGLANIVPQIYFLNRHWSAVLFSPPSAIHIALGVLLTCLLGELLASRGNQPGRAAESRLYELGLTQEPLFVFIYTKLSFCVGYQSNPLFTIQVYTLSNFPIIPGNPKCSREIQLRYDLAFPQSQAYASWVFPIQKGRQ